MISAACLSFSPENIKKNEGGTKSVNSRFSTDRLDEITDGHRRRKRRTFSLSLSRRRRFFFFDVHISPTRRTTVII